MAARACPGGGHLLPIGEPLGIVRTADPQAPVRRGRRPGGARLSAVCGGCSAVGACRDDPRLEHGLHRRHRRQRGAAGAPARARGHRRRRPVGRRGLRALPLGAAARRRLHGGSLRTAPRLRERDRPLRRGVDRLRPRRQRRAARDRPRRAGGRCGAPRAGQPRHHQRVVPRAGAGASHRDVVRLHRDHDRPRARPRRLADRAPLVALGLLREPAPRRGRARAGLLAAAGEPRSRGAPAARLGRCRARDRGARGHRVRAHRVVTPRMAAPAGLRGTRRGRWSPARVRRRRGPEPHADGSAGALPIPELHRDEPPHAAPLRRPGGRLLLPAARPHPGAAVLPDCGGRRLPPLRPDSVSALAMVGWPG